MNPEYLIAREIFGVDPGVSGGIAKWSDRVEVWNMPRSLDDLCDFFDYQKSICKNPLVILEKVQLWQGDENNKQGQNVGRQFRIQKMLNQYAELRSTIRSRGFQYIEVSPVSWQSFLSIRIKDEERAVRKRRFKDIASEWYPSVKVTLNNADALLLIEFMRRKLKYNPLWVTQNIQKKSDKILFNE